MSAGAEDRSILQLHRPSGAGEDRNYARQILSLPVWLLHRPSGAGEDRNTSVSVSPPATAAVAPALRGR